MLGIEGLALLRGVITGSDENAADRVAGLRRFLASDDAALDEPIAFPEHTVEHGYAAWSETYDRPGNPLIHLEETVLLPLLASLRPGRALDAACGTGRVAAHLAAAGHDVVGVDTTPEMLELARRRVPGARFVEGRLQALPVEDASFDVVVCCLALEHSAELGPPVSELARAARQGGRVVVTNLHPFLVQLGGQGAFTDSGGTWGFVRSYPHLPGDYLRAFAAAGLELDELFEPTPDRTWFELQPAAWAHAPEAFLQGFEGIPAASIWSLVRR